MGFTGRLGTGNSRLGNILLSAINTLGDGTFDYQVHQIEGNKIRVVFNTQIRIPSATDPAHYSLDIVIAPGSYVIPNIVNIVPYDADNESIVLNLDKNLTTGATYTLELGEIFDVNGDTVSFVAKNFDANVIIPPLAKGAFQSKNGHVDILFDKNVGATALTATASIRDAAGGPLVPMTLVTWAGESLPNETLRFQLPPGMPTADSFVIEYTNVEDESYNIGAGEIPLTLVLRTSGPYDFNALNQVQIIDSYVTDLSNDQIDTTNLRVYFNGPINSIDALNTASWDIRAQDIHKNQDTINLVTAPIATDESSLYYLVSSLITASNAHYIEEQVHFTNAPSLVLPDLPLTIDPYNIDNIIDPGKKLDVDAQINPGSNTSLGCTGFNDTGTICYATDVGNNNRMYEYSLSTPWELDTGSYTGNFFNFGFPDPRRFCWSNNGTRLFVSFNGGIFRSYSASTAYDITTLVYDGITVSLTSAFEIGIAVNNAGTRLYTCDVIGNLIREYNLLTPYNLTTASFFSSYTEPALGSVYFSLCLRNDELGLYLVSTVNYGFGPQRAISQINFTVPNALTTATLYGYRPTDYITNQVDAVAVGKNGERLYYTVRGTSIEAIVQWDAGVISNTPAAIASLQVLQINFLNHLYAKQTHYFIDLVNDYEIEEVVDVPTAISVANKVRASMKSHIDPQPLLFSNSYPIGEITERANFGNITAYDVRCEYTYFVDLHLVSRSPFARYNIAVTVNSEDASSITNPLNETGSMLSRSLEDPIGTIATYIDVNKAVELFFDKEVYLLLNSKIEIKNSNGKPIAIEQEALSLLPTLEWVYNQLIYAYSLHIGSNNGLAHKTNDTINAINLPDYVSTASISDLISKANAFRTKLDIHISSETYHFNPDTDITKAQPAFDILSLTKLLLDLRQTFLRHNARDGVHDGVGNRIVSAKFYDIVKLTTDKIQNEQLHSIAGMIRAFYYNNNLKEPRYTDNNINETFIGYADRPSLASVIPKSGLANSNGELAFESDSVEFYFSKRMQEVPLDITNIIITGGSIQQKLALWKNDMVANVEVIKMEQISYNGTAVGLLDKAGNPIY